MPDITMCGTEDCGLKGSCYRSPASGTRPTEWRQSWSAFSPFATDEGTQLCEHYWPTERPSPNRPVVPEERSDG